MRKLTNPRSIKSSMAKINIRGRNDGVFVSDERAQEVKRIWLEGEREATLDLGEWCGTFGQIKSIDIEPTVSTADRHDYELTPEEQKRADAAKERVGKWLRERWAKGNGVNHNISYMNPLNTEE